MANSKTRSFKASTCADAVKQLRGLTTYDSHFKRDGQPTVVKPTPPDKQWTVKATLTWSIAVDDITVTLPDWSDIPDDDDCKAAWQDAVSRLSTHEDAHVKICEKLKSDLDTLQQSAQSDIQAADNDKGKAIKQFTDAVTKETKRLKDEYDRLKKDTDDTNKKFDSVTTNGQNPGVSGDNWSLPGAKSVTLDCSKCP